MNERTMETLDIRGSSVNTKYTRREKEIELKMCPHLFSIHYLFLRRFLVSIWLRATNKNSIEFQIHNAFSSCRIRNG